MWEILIIVFVAVFIYFVYIIMSKLDKYLAKNSVEIQDENKNQIAIILGKNTLSNQVGELLEKNKILVFPLNEPFLLEQEKNFRYLFALSENDIDNIILCQIGKRLYGIKEMISICNDRTNESIFISKKIRYLPSESVTVPKLWQAVIKETEVEL